MTLPFSSPPSPHFIAGTCVTKRGVIRPCLWDEMSKMFVCVCVRDGGLRMSNVVMMMMMRRSQRRHEWHWRTEEMAAAVARSQTWTEKDEKSVNVLLFFKQTSHTLPNT